MQTNLEDAIDAACRKFEAAWHENPDVRIEDVLDDIKDIVRVEKEFSRRPELLDRIMCELIHVEMDLRASNGEFFRKAKYESRFPNQDEAVESAWQRLKCVYPANDLFTTAVLRTDERCRVEQNHAREAVPEIFGPFQNIEPIDEGGFGVVCKGLDGRSDQWVALKFPHRDVISNDFLLESFRGEAERVVGLRHAGIVETHSVEFHNGYVAIVQQLISGSNLKSSMARFANHKDAAQLVARIADALAYANRNGVIHRDLKPANILLDEDDQPYISDFGLSIHESDQPLSYVETCGTAPYMSPQMVEGLTRNLDGRTDIWSLGIILYELLTGKRPFVGISRFEVFEQIETRDPKPIREIDPSIDRELQRICLKCLEKAARDRYMTADELAEDLRHWIRHGQEALPLVPAIVPRGLRSYGARDASFFSSLLPGPRDRYGMPESVQFWIDFLQADELDSKQLPVGVLCGPSGSGKSSFVKAAVLPKVSEQLEVLYVECTRADTEVRLLKAIRGLLVDVPNELSLTDLFRGIAAGLWNPERKRIAIVLDQFEQRLGINDRYELSQIAKAMRHCNKDFLMCLLVVRDGFWLALTRFFDALEMDILENRNFRSIDLFDKSHAEKVLRQLGRAYGKLPAEPKPLTNSQRNFIESTVNQLAKGHYVVCIQLVVFAEMFKLRNWEQSELKSIGGVTGVGEAFLDYHFGEDSQQSRYKPYREQVQNALEALLPDDDSRIRGALKSEAELKKSVGLTSDERGFEELLQILERDVRLISRTDPDRGSVDLEDSDLNSESKSASYFQLTHDYLVPSIRSWMDQVRQKSPASRARSRLASLARSWTATGDKRYLPSAMEFGSMLRFVRYRDLVPDEKGLFRKAISLYLRRAAAVVGVLVVMATALLIYRSKNREMAESYVSSFVVAEKPEAVEKNIVAMSLRSADCLSLLKSRATAIDLNDREQVRLYVGIARLEDKPSSNLLSRLVDQVSAENDHRGETLIRVFKSHRSRALSMLKKRFDSLQVPDADSPEDQEKRMSDMARVAASIVSLNAAKDIEDQLGGEQQFVFRMEFVNAFSKWSTPDLDHEVLTGLGKDKAIGAVCLAVGHWSEVRQKKIPHQLDKQLREFLKPPNSNYVKSAASWACRDSRTPKPVKSSMIRIGNGEDAFFILDREILATEFNKFLAAPDNGLHEVAKPVTLDSNEAGYPASNVSLIDGILFCNWLSKQHNLEPCYERTDENFRLPDYNTPEERKYFMNEVVSNHLNKWHLIPNKIGYRLPTHSQWEQAANYKAMLTLPSNLLTQVGHFGKMIQPVCRKMPNENGMFDMYGNVNEACWMEDDQHLLAETCVNRGGTVETPLNEAVPRMPSEDRPYIRFMFKGFRIVRPVSK